MAISSTSKATLDDNGSSDWVKVYGYGRQPSVSIGNADDTWGGSTEAALEWCADANADSPVPCPVEDSSGAVVATANTTRVLNDIGGYVRITVTNYSGSDPIEIAVV